MYGQPYAGASGHGVTEKVAAPRESKEFQVIHQKAHGSSDHDTHALLAIITVKLTTLFAFFIHTNDKSEYQDGAVAVNVSKVVHHQQAIIRDHAAIVQCVGSVIIGGFIVAEFVHVAEFCAHIGDVSAHLIAYAVPTVAFAAHQGHKHITSVSGVLHIIFRFIERFASLVSLPYRSYSSVYHDVETHGLRLDVAWNHVTTITKSHSCNQSQVNERVIFPHVEVHVTAQR